MDDNRVPSLKDLARYQAYLPNINWDEKFCDDLNDFINSRHKNIDILYDVLNTDLTEDQIKKVKPPHEEKGNVMLKFSHYPAKIINVLFLYKCIKTIKLISTLMLFHKRLEFFNWPLYNFVYNPDKPYHAVITRNSGTILTALLDYINDPEVKEIVIGLLGSIEIDPRICNYIKENKGKLPRNSHLNGFVTMYSHTPLKDIYKDIKTLIMPYTENSLSFIFAYIVFKDLIRIRQMNHLYADEYREVFTDIEKKYPAFYRKVVKYINNCFTQENFFAQYPKGEILNLFWDSNKGKLHNKIIVCNE